MQILLWLAAALFVFLAVFANRIGLDHTADWGASRVLLLVIGLAAGALAGLRAWLRSERAPQGLLRTLAGLRGGFRRAGEGLRGRLWISAALCGLVVLAASAYAAWFTSYGKFPQFRRDFNPYVELGEAFLHGQAALLEQPDPRLTALADPVNDYAAREKVPYIWDLSYYRGKYYLYWGPVPALVYAAAEAISGARPADQFGLLLFFGGSGALAALILFQARRLYFPRAPGLSIVFFVLAALINLPFAYLLTGSKVYETAVIAGQFFLLAGLACWLEYRRSRRTLWLALTGLGYGLAVGSRFTLLLAVGIFTVAALWDLLRAGGWLGQIRRDGVLRARFVRQGLALLLPLAACGALLAGYNAVRFGSPFETGLRFQLAFPWYQKQYYSTAFLPSNLYVTLLNPLPIKDSFPFFPAVPLKEMTLPAWAALTPGKTFEEVIVGLLPCLPVLWLGGLLLAAGLAGGVRAAKKTTWAQDHAHSQPGNTKTGKAENRSLKLMGDQALEADRLSRSAGQDGAPGRGRLGAAAGWELPGDHQGRAAADWGLLAGALALAGLAQWVFLLFYYYGAMRFYADFTLLWLLALALGLWRVDAALRDAGGRWAAGLRAGMWGLAALLCLLTAFIGFFGAFDIPPQGFRQNNEALYYAVAGQANHWADALKALPESSGLLGAAIRLLLRLAR
jgi:hypothetical protein